MKDLIRKTQEYKDLRAKAREAIAAFEDGADFDFTIDRLAAIGENPDVSCRCRHGMKEHSPFLKQQPFH